jgi:hypothetical protein
MHQKSVQLSVMAKQPSRTTVAQMKASVPRRLTAFSRTASCMASTVSWCSGGATLGSSAPERTRGVIVAFCGSNGVAGSCSWSGIRMQTLGTEKLAWRSIKWKGDPLCF